MYLYYTILSCLVAVVGLTKQSLTVREDDGSAMITVAVMGDALASNAELVVRLFTLAGTASGQ